MAGLVGVLMRGRGPADLAPVSLMAAAAPYRSPDGSWTWREGPFAAARLRTICTPEDAYERVPVVNHSPPAVVLFDGRLDNRAELASELEIHPAALRSLSDASVALRAWIRWREGVAKRLVGDFALVAWDRPASAVFCATDTFSVRPLYYYLSTDVFVFATELAQLLAHPLVPRRPDERAVGELLCGNPRTPGLTPYDHVRRLRHAHFLVVEQDRERLHQYWDPPTSVVRRSNDEEYADAFREHFDRAVAARLRSAGPVGVHLSGGVDSSSVTVTAAQLPGCPDLTAVSLAFQVPPRADEREFANAVLRHADVRGVVIEPPPFDPGELVAQVRDRLHLPDLPNCHGAAQLRSAMNARGIRVCLTGGGGDIGLEGSDYYFADLLKQGKLTTFLRRYGEVVSSRTHAWRSTELLQYALWPVLPYPFRRALRPLARRVAGLGLPTWIDPALVRRAGLAEPPAMARPGAGTSIANETVARGYDDGLAHLVHDLYEVGSSRAGIYDRHPFLDRRLVEYILRLPDDQRWRKGRSKFVLRQAMGERLPAVVRHRSDRSKADFSHLLDLALEGIGGRLFFEHLSIERMGWVTPGELPRLYDRMRQLRRLHAAEYRDLTWQLWFAAAVELWHSRVFDNPIRRNPWTSATRAPEWRQMSNPAAPLANRIAARNSSSTGRLPS